MKPVYTVLTLALVFTTTALAQEKTNENLPYYNIPKNPETYTAGTVAGRMIDGLGFRYYWATEGLRAEDMDYKPSEEARTTGQTIDHILGLSGVILKAATQEEAAKPKADMTYTEKRALTLQNLKKASDIMKMATDLTKHEIKFSEQFKLPFWNNINGPIADAIWHSGQLVVLRRASGNPIAKGVNVMMGTKR